MTERFSRPEEGFGHREEAAVPYEPGPAATSSGLALAKTRNEGRLLAIKGVKGVGIGRNAIGDDAIVVFLVDDSVGRQLPAEVDGFPVETVVTGEIDAYDSHLP